MAMECEELCFTSPALPSEVVESNSAAFITNNVSHSDDVNADLGDCNVSNPDLEAAILDGVKEMHVSIAGSIDDGRSSVEILSPTFNNHFQQTEELPILEAAFPADKLRAMLKTRLEYYFSPENLSQDKYLLTQMDRDQWVPISIIAGFNQVKRLTHRVELVTEVLKESAVVEVDEVTLKVRPASKRRTIILREIPEGTKKEDVEVLFHGEGCPQFVDCVFAHNGHWYVTFLNEEEAQRALFFLREKGRTFNGEPIKARLKAGLPLSVSTSTYVRPGQNGIVSMPSYEASSDSPVAATVAIPLPAKCAYTPLPAVQYIQHPSYPFFPPPQVWPASVYIANDASLAAATAFYPAGIPTHMAPTYLPGAAVGNVGYINTRQRPRRGSGSSLRGGSSTQSGRHQAGIVDGSGNLASTVTQQPPRFSRRHVTDQQHSPDTSETLSTASSNATNGPVSISTSNHSVSTSIRAFASADTSIRGPPERSRAVASAQSSHVSPNADSSTSSFTGDGHQAYPNYGRSPISRRGGASYRGRRRGGGWNDDSNSRVDQRKPRESDNFELEATSFPPLPGNTLSVISSEIAATDSKTLSDIVKGVGKSSSSPAALVEKLHAVAVPVANAPASSAARHQPPNPGAPVFANCDSELLAPASSTVANSRGRISRSTSTDSLVAVTSEQTATSSTGESPSTSNTTGIAVHTNTEESKPRAKLSYAQIAQRGKENNDCSAGNGSSSSGGGSSVAGCADSSSSESASSEQSKDGVQSSQVSSMTDSKWKGRSGPSASFEQRQASNTSASHLKNSRFPGGRGAAFASGDTRQRQRVYNGVAVVGSYKQ